MVRNLTIGLGALIWSLVGIPTGALAQQLACGDHADVVSALEKNYSEAPVSLGLANNGNIFEIFTSDSGSWTIVMTQPGGVSCVVSAGERWESRPTKLVGAQI